jgi:NAD(P)H dehydrogenase (quinone)
MNCLVVYAHPLKKSLCGSLFEVVAQALADNDHDCRFADLYEADFDPRLSGTERASYYAAYDNSGIAQEVRDLEWAEVVVLVFPTWWFSMPAILKGWFDRVWAPGVAYDHDANLGAIKPRLKKLRTVVAVTTLGSPWWVDRLVMWQPVRRTIGTAILRSCAPQARFFMLSLYNSERVRDNQFNIFRAKLRHTISRNLR